MKEGQPIWITNLFVNRPWTVLIIGYLILIAATVVAVVNDYFALTPQNNRDFLIWDDERVIPWDMQQAGRNAILAAQSSTKVSERVQDVSWWNAIMVYQVRNENESLLDKKYLLQIQQIEKSIQEKPDWVKFCRATSVFDKNCHPQKAFVSPISFLKMLGITDIENTP